MRTYIEYSFNKDLLLYCSIGLNIGFALGLLIV
jgi:hypothetical protein